MRKTLWVMSELYYPEETSTGYILTKIAESLAQEHQVRVLCGQPTYSARGVQAPARELHNGVEIQRCPATTFNKDILWLRLVNFVTISLSLFFYALRKVKKNDQILVVTNPPLLPFLVALVCYLRGARYLLLTHDVYPDLLVAVGNLKATSRLVRIVERLNRPLYRHATRIIVLGRDMQTLVVDKICRQEPSQASTLQRAKARCIESATARREALSPECASARREALSPEQIVVIPNWADIALITPTPRQENALLRELALTDKFVLTYAGNMGYPNDIESMAASAVQLREEREIHFLFIGSGVKKKWLEKITLEHQLPNLTLLPNRPRSDQTNFLNACDLAVISLVRGMKGVSSPSRLYNTLAAGKPILAIAEAQSELALVVQEEGIGWVAPPGQPQQLTKIILEAKRNRAHLSVMGCRARAVAEQKYAFAKVMDAYQQLLRGVA